ncbi:TonB C-terminal domain-containing protein [Pseudomonas amygdali pv. lachrymans]|nr:hypothetical protein ASC85_08500 [Pseudomonas sp. Root401]PWD02069.1 TonB C-terminal domain-containing protein [Pseudomonas amygdali pv. lachrymans]
MRRTLTLKELKKTYVALTLSIAAVAVTGASTILSALPNSARINALAAEVETLNLSNASLAQQLEVERQNRARIDELDVGLTGIATVLKVDRAELAKAIVAARSAKAELVSRQSSASVTQVSQSSHSPQPNIAGQGVLGAPTSVSSDQRVPLAASTAATTATTVPEAKAISSTLGADNPFATPADSNEAPAALTVASNSHSPELLSIEQVDAVLGKRISESWYKPAGAADGLSAIVQLQMARDGKVFGVKLTKASGNTAFDNSAISALKSIGAIEEVKRLSDADFKKGYAVRSIQFTPQMGS